MTMHASNIRRSVINRATAIVEPTDDGILEDLAKKSVRCGEEALMFAVLKSCVEDLQKYADAKTKKGKELYSQAEQWVLQKDSEFPFSFESICEVLNFNPDYIRNGLLQCRKTKRACSRKRRAA
jgi:hypothetical protein